MTRFCKTGGGSRKTDIHVGEIETDIHGEIERRSDRQTHGGGGGREKEIHALFSLVLTR